VRVFAAARNLEEQSVVNQPLPESLRPLFWDYDFEQLGWPEHRDFVIARILQNGGDDAIAWLHEVVGDTELARWLRERRGRGLDPRQMRYWQVILDLPAQEVDQWIEAANFAG
jgi:hypothetical protein